MEESFVSKERESKVKPVRKKSSAADEFADSMVSFKLAFLALVVLFLIYTGLSWVAHRALYGTYVKPLPYNASLHKFSEGRTMKHIQHLAEEIGIRQEGSVGLSEAANYLKLELESYRQRASSNLRVEIDQAFVNGSFNMVFLKRSIGLAYRNHTNIAIRISPAIADEDAPAVLVNGHFDSAIGSPGAGDCASCVATMLETVRLIIDTDWVPPSPLIFLFNGAEELFMVACHGFMTTHKWRFTIGALINIESGGTGGPDVVCQSGPGSWPIEVYAQSAVYPMASKVAKDVFKHLPGDTDYRIFSEDFGDIPGLDIILLLEGYFYHTPYDRPERMVPGSMQIRGENLVGLLRAFSGSSKLLNARDRARVGNTGDQEDKKELIFFDFLGWFMISYSFEKAVIFHTIPFGFVLFASSLASYKSSGMHQFSERILYTAKGALLHSIQIALAFLFPVMLAIFRLLPASTAMPWFSRPWLALLIYVPISVAGMLVPNVLLSEKLLMKGSTHGSDDKKPLDWGAHWGTIAFYALGAAVGTHFSVGIGFFSFWWACCLLVGYYLQRALDGTFGQNSILTYTLYILSSSFPILLSLYAGGLLWQMILEKMGMNGSVPQPLGFFVADIVIGAITGYVVILSLAPLIPVISRWLGSARIIYSLIFLSIFSAAMSSQFFPYSPSAPKRVLLQHSLYTKGDQILYSYYDLAVLDANSVPFVFQHVEAVPRFLSLPNDFSFRTATRSPWDTWMALYPIPHLFTESFRFPAGSKDVMKNHPTLPHLLVRHVEHSLNRRQKRTHLELDMGSLHEIWAAVLNITGPLLSWSFSGEQLPAPEVAGGGPPSYVCRLSGNDKSKIWNFWLEANESMVLRVDLAVLDQQLEEETTILLRLFPPWTAPIAGSSYLSSYVI